MVCVDYGVKLLKIAAASAQNHSADKRTGHRRTRAVGDQPRCVQMIRLLTFSVRNLVPAKNSHICSELYQGSSAGSGRDHLRVGVVRGVRILIRSLSRIVDYVLSHRN